MKKLSILILLILISNIHSHAQLEVIDKIAGVLIPGITKGINEVLASSNSNKVKKDEIEKLKKDYTEQTKSLLTSIDADLSNVSALNELFGTTGALFDNVAVMKMLTTKDFLDEIISTNSQTLMKEVAINFALNWRQVEAKKDKLVNLTKDATEGSIQDDIAQYVNTLDNNLNFLITVVSLEKNPSNSMDMPTAKSYMENLKRAQQYISEIEKSINAINVQLTTRIKSFSKSLKTIKDKVSQ
jgi:hypothetical protein